MSEVWSNIVAQIDAGREAIVDALLDVVVEAAQRDAVEAVQRDDVLLLRHQLATLTQTLIAHLAPEHWQPQVVHEIGASLSRLSSGNIIVLTRTHHILYDQLVARLPDAERAVVLPQIIATLAEIAGGFSVHRTASATHEHQQRVETASSDRVKFEEISRQNDAWLRLMISGTPMILVAVDQNCIIKLIDGKALQALGMSPSRMVGISVEAISQKLQLSEAHPVLGHFRKALEGETFISLGAAGGIEFETHYAPLRDESDEIVGAVAVAIDTTERSQIAAELAHSHQRLTERIEAERLHLAHELHDDSLQRLLAVSYQLGLTTRNLSHTEQTERVPDAVLLGRIEVARQEVLSVVRQLRVLIGDLRPPALDVFGLPAALETYVERLRRTLQEQTPSLVLELDVVEKSLSQPITLCLFRVAQECVRNAMKYAQAQQIVIHLSIQKDLVVLSIRDDGCGFEVPPILSQLTRNDHYGLVGLTERVEWTGGTLSLYSEPGYGTEVIARIPLL